MLKIHLERVKGTTFKGYVEVADLTPAQLEELHIPADTDLLSVDVMGDYDFEVYRGEVTIIGVSAFAYEGIHELELTQDNADLDGLMDDIQDSDIPYELALCSGYDYTSND